MAMYFQGSSDIQADGGLQTLYLMNPNYNMVYDTQQQQQPTSTNMFFFNSITGNGQNPAIISHAPPPQQNQPFVGVPLPNVWGAVDQIGNSADVSSHLSFQRQLASNSPTQQGLSLSLSPQENGGLKSLSAHHLDVSSSSISSFSNRIPGVQSMILDSKYLKAAQEILDEVVNVGKYMKNDLFDRNKNKGKMIGEDVSTRVAAELTTAQRQELQTKKAKLVSLLDEVEQRYRQYHHQMQIIVASFEQAAGIGSAKSYTQLALHTISKQFRCLKDAITAQIKAAAQSLGEEEGLGGKTEGSRLKFVDNHLRQQRALQQLGMMQPNAWRPQRGLPEKAVLVLRAWLFEHFLHPYPKDSDKIILAKQTGLTRSQVSNWFINARVRLWKPMVEEMYGEEMKNNQEQNEVDQENASKNDLKKEMITISTAENKTTQIDSNIAFQSKQDRATNQEASPAEISINSTVTATSPTAGPHSLQAQVGFAFMGSSSNPERTAKKPRHDMQSSPSSILSMDMELKEGEKCKGFNVNNERETMENYPYNGFNTLAAGFHGNGVSLTLGLPPSENITLSGTQHNYYSAQNLYLHYV